MLNLYTYQIYQLFNKKTLTEILIGATNDFTVGDPDDFGVGGPDDFGFGFPDGFGAPQHFLLQAIRKEKFKFPQVVQSQSPSFRITDNMRKNYSLRIVIYK